MKNLEIISNLINIRNYVGYITYNTPVNIDKKDMDNIYEKMLEIDKKIISMIKEMKL